uniref:Homeobox protein siamois n=1 Tax=Leptobrachium leishanense TaxID=445787 RepID=A0A8C5MGE2_9ANUR
MDHDVELDQIVSTILSLEEDYPVLVLPQSVYENTMLSSFLQPFPSSQPPEKIQGPLLCTEVEEQIQVVPSPGLETTHEAEASKPLDQGILAEEMHHNPQGMFLNNTHSKGVKRPFTEEEEEGCSRYTSIDDIIPTSSLKKKYQRAQYNEEQTTFLLDQFQEDPYPDFMKRCQISNITRISEPRVQVWFQNRRARHRKKNQNSDNSYDF